MNPESADSYYRLFETTVGATILPGICVGKHSIIGACSVVTKDVPDYGVVVGNPAKLINTLDENKFED